MPEFYRVFAVLDDGSRVLVRARQLVIDLAPDRELIIELQDYKERHELVLRTESSEDRYSSVVIRPGACNLIHLALEPHSKTNCQRQRDS
jgi:hypothetical protein